MRVELPHPFARAHRITTGFVALEEKIQLILDTLGEVARVEFSKLLEPWKDRIHGVMTLLAGLELSRQRAVTLRQARLFSELWIFRRDLEAWMGEPASEERAHSPEAESTAGDAWNTGNGETGEIPEEREDGV
jgi:chromatin segregation and condensation protein Rec8/ScpA/Scc1 (kleisin family)